MRLLDAFRRAEEQGREVARRGRERAGELLEDAERRIRRKMRIHPRRSSADLKRVASSPVAADDIDKPAA